MQVYTHEQSRIFLVFESRIIEDYNGIEAGGIASERTSSLAYIDTVYRHRRALCDLKYQITGPD